MTPTSTHTPETGEQLVDVVPGGIETPTPVLTPHDATAWSRSPDDNASQPARRGHGRPDRRRAMRAVALGVAAIAAIGTTATVVLVTRDEATAPPSTVVDEGARLRELVERGLIPAQTLESASTVVDEGARLRELVERGLVPAQTLESMPLNQPSRVPGNVR